MPTRTIPARIGLVLKSLDEEYQSSIYAGVKKAAMEKGLELICIQGEDFDDDSGQERPSFQSCGILPLDGILLLSSILIDNESILQEKREALPFPDLTAITIGSVLPGLPAVLVQSEKPFKALVDHLIHHHQYRRFLYIGGPKTNRDNALREKMLGECLSQAAKDGLECRLVKKNGPVFSERTGVVAISDYIKTHPLRDIDAIIAGSDDVAIGVLKYLKSQGESSWAECPLTGFDDIPLTSATTPSITTVHQPLEAMGRTAVYHFLDEKAGRKTDRTVFVPAELRIRESCGCRKIPDKRSNFPVSVLEREKLLQRDAGYLGQSLMSVDSYAGLIIPLREFLVNAGIRQFHFIIWNDPDLLIPESGRLLFTKSEQEEADYSDRYQAVNITEYFRDVLKETADAPSVYGFFQLKNGRERLGLLLFTAEDESNASMNSCGVFLAHAVKRIQWLEKEQANTRNLELQVQERTRELKEEARKRLAVEAEVLKISDLERMRFSMDLHDDICQRLASITSVCKNFSAKDPVFKTLYEMADEALERTRRYAHDSFPTDIESIGFREALEVLCENFSLGGSVNLICGLPRTPLPELTGQQKINIYRIAQEALQNAMKHSGADEIALEIRIKDDTLCLKIQDNGNGDEKLMDTPSVNTEKRRPRGLGLQSMRYRARQLSADIRIESSKDKGTKIMVGIPLEGNLP